MITSREKIYEFAPVNLELLDRNESRELLLKIAEREPTGENEKEHLEQILEILGDIPLAVELVGGYLAEHETVTFEKYHQFLDEVPLGKLEKEFPDRQFYQTRPEHYPNPANQRENDQRKTFDGRDSESSGVERKFFDGQIAFAGVGRTGKRIRI